MTGPPAERRLIIDASAVLAFLYREPGGSHLAELAADPQNRCFIHVMNLCEIYYDLLRRKVELANTLELALRAAGFQIAAFGSTPWRKAGRLKAELRRVSLADCFAVTLARELDGEIVSCDRHELGPLHQAGVCRCLFLR